MVSFWAPAMTKSKSSKKNTAENTAWWLNSKPQMIGIQTKLSRPSEKRLMTRGPGWVAQSIIASSQYSEVVGSIPGKGTYKNQPMNA